jgi:hypothetical protein
MKRRVVPDGLTHHVADWIARTLTTSHEIVSAGDHALVEVEAKLGVLRDKVSSGRVRLPVESETVISDSIHQHVRFESNMTRVSWQSLSLSLSAGDKGVGGGGGALQVVKMVLGEEEEDVEGWGFGRSIGVCHPSHSP